MPIYEYRCTACNRISEEWVRSFDASDTETCPHCGQVSQRIMSHTSFQLKGGGWYVTDYGSHKHVPAESADASPASSTLDASPASAPDTAPAVSSETAAPVVPVSAPASPSAGAAA